MNQITIMTVDALDPPESVAIARRLTNRGSDFQLEVLRVASGEISSCTPIALWHHDGAVVAWACSHVWDEMQTLEHFTDERHRRTGKAAALSAALVAAGVLDRYKPLAVFSTTTAHIAARLGFTEVQRYERLSATGAWVAVG